LVKNFYFNKIKKKFILAFLPPEPTYSLHVADILTSTTNGTIDQKLSSTNKSPSDSNTSIRYTIIFSEKSEWQQSQTDIAKLEPYFVTTSRHNRIACLYVNCTSDPKYYILFSHGNAVDLGK
jgi:hypothetical protein